ncbi:hypothetical protein HRE53_27880 (plasmid) [Acaryochloris sp. 'Moss Beach']|uniref:hypothetical protein n=1 Tax=Acaryochloris sp. 'Moss Beach' TaxID=2740837 RepID=UPI001F40663F|nr:hypothetical protein [Acaryochloris sp. 'Moss Beach']UJB72644.1 hypothetical protein HRE53_27880 [Acaryochloris sp. 'Moss Beach']
MALPFNGMLILQTNPNIQASSTPNQSPPDPNHTLPIQVHSNHLLYDGQSALTISSGGYDILDVCEFKYNLYGSNLNG